MLELPHRQYKHNKHRFSQASATAFLLLMLDISSLHLGFNMHLANFSRRNKCKVDPCNFNSQHRNTRLTFSSSSLKIPILGMAPI